MSVIAIRYNPEFELKSNFSPLSAARQLGVIPTFGIWAGVCLGIGLLASWEGFGGRGSAAAMTVFALCLAVAIFPAASGGNERLGTGGAGWGFAIGAVLFAVYVAYVASVGFAAERVAAGAGLVFAPLALAASAKRSAPGAWQDYVIIAGVWTAVKFGPAEWLWPYPGGRAAHVMMILFCLSTAVAAFLAVRHVSGAGYNIGWGPRWEFFVAASFVAFACIAIPLGESLHFVEFAPRWGAWKALPLTAAMIFLFTAWPEEFLFRGLLQNMLAKSSKSEFAGWWTASVLFGFSHITNGGFPNWRYVILASIAGFFYGWTWKRTGSIFASAMVHGLVDVTWHFLFRTI